MRSYPIRFDTGVPYVEISAYLGAVSANERLLRHITRSIFGDKSAFEIVVYAEEPGSVWHWVGIGSILTGTFAFLESDIGKGAIEGYFGKEPRDISRLLAAKLPGAVKFEGDLGESDENVEDLVEDLAVQVAQKVLLADPVEIERTSRARIIPNDVVLEYNAFFASCSLDDQIASIGFPGVSEQPISRSEFTARMSAKGLFGEDEVEHRREVRVDVIEVNGPLMDRGVQRTRRWSGRLPNGGLCTFKIEDEQFWTRLDAHEISFTRGTSLTVQWSFERTPKGQRDYEVHRVLAVDGNVIAEPLDDSALSAVVKDYIHTINDIEGKKVNGDQGELFPD